MQNAITFYDHHPKASNLYQEVLTGLRRKPKSIAPKFFYDKRGSELFEAICETHEYYPTRTEIKILEKNADDIAEAIGDGCILFEPGSGNSQKVRILLDSIKPDAYIPLDISKEFLRSSAQQISEEYPWLDVHAACIDYTQHIKLPQQFDKFSKVAFFPGSSIGNFEPKEAVSFLRQLSKVLGHQGGLIIGVDLKKEPHILKAAYNDEEGQTAAFNKNLLARINRELAADFVISQFKHHAFYNEDGGRIEMHLVSDKDQQVRIDNELIQFESGESIHTENSYKYHIEEFQQLAKLAGFSPEEVWTDADELFSVQYFKTE